MKKFFAGWLCHGATLSLLMDYWGKDKTLYKVSTEWIDWKITVPYALVVMIAVIILYRMKNPIVID